MNRRTLLTRLGLAAGTLLAGRAVLNSQLAPAASSSGTNEAFPPLHISRDEWKQILDKDSYYILFAEGTERAFSSPLDKIYETGTYICAACYLPLFSSDDKFDSGTGWPSFTKPIYDAHIGTKRDFKLILPRTEYHCARCDGHQGHVFNDGPPPTGQRWCNNGLALNFVAKGEPVRALRISA